MGQPPGQPSQFASGRLCDCMSAESVLLCPGVALQEGLICASVCSFPQAALPGGCDAPSKSTFCAPTLRSDHGRWCAAAMPNLTQRSFHFLLLHFNDLAECGRCKSSFSSLVLLKVSEFPHRASSKTGAFQKQLVCF